jgi:predicted transcriptional regulator YdeE
MEKQTIEKFNVIGISVRTTNENNQAATDIPALWAKFMGENLASKIPNKIDETLYCIYTEYESDFTKPYSTILGCAVENLDSIPDGFVGLSIEKGSYKKFTAKGNLMEGAVYKEWTKIWNTSIDRKYTADFEIYGEKSQNQKDAEVDILIAVR